MSTCQIHERYSRIKCQNPALPEDPQGCCILHSQDKEKDPAAFRQAVLAISTRGDSEYHDFRAVFFPGPFDPQEYFGTREFNKAVDFSRATFQEANFYDATFTEGADFSWATFTEGADFSGATFTKLAEFSGATFMEWVDFSSATFAKEANFLDATFAKWAGFSGATFTKEANFFRATFTEEADFSKTTFSGRAGFSWATFSGEADFSWATFSGEADFSWATFSGRADFSMATFSGLAVFYGATFSEKAFFVSATFSKGADFIKATFSGEPRFYFTTFSKIAVFSASRVKGNLYFVGLNPGAGGKPGIIFNGAFDFITIDIDGLLQFRDLSLAQVTLAGSNLLKCEFVNVDWHPFRCRNAIYDEVRLYEKEVAWVCHLLTSRWIFLGVKFPALKILEKLVSRLKESHLFPKIRQKSIYCHNLFPHSTDSKNKPDKPETREYARVEECYRYLKLNYEGAGDFKKAGDFHYGEMEMHRRGNAWRRWFPFSWYNLYRFLSGYGEGPVRALICLAGLILGLAGLVFWLEPKIAGGWAGLREALFYLLAQATFQRPDWFKPETDWGKFIRIISPFLIPGQAALFLLALRNRLGRRR